MTQMPVPEYIRTLVPYVPGKPIEEAQREYGLDEVMKLASNENPLGPSPKAVRAIRDALGNLHRYPDSNAYYLKRDLSRWLGVGSESLLMGNGSNEIIDLLVRTYCIRGDAILTSQAAFAAYRICAQIHGVASVETPLSSDLRFDLAAMIREIRQNQKIRIIFIPNPNNPTGTYVNRNELESFFTELSDLKKRKVLVVLDSAYWEYVMAPDFPNPHELQKKHRNVVILRTFSKIYGLAGLRVGYAMADPQLIATLEKVRQPFNINSLGQIGARAALSDQGFVEKSRKSNQRGMKFFEAELDRLKIPYWGSQGNFILIDVGRGLRKTGTEVYASSLKQGVVFRPVANYGLENALRVSIGTPSENRKAILVLAKSRKR